MSGSTTLIIIKSLLPFVKEAILGNKALKDIINENRPAAFLAACVAFMFYLVVVTSGTADNALRDLKRITEERASLREEVKLKDLEIYDLKGLVSRGCQCTPVVMPSDPPLTDPPQQSPAGKSRVNLKSHVQDRLSRLK